MQVFRCQDVLNAAVGGFRRIQKQELELAIGAQLRMCLQDHIGQDGVADVLFVDDVEELAEIEAPCREYQRRVLMETAGSVVDRLEARQIDAQAGGRAGIAARDIELQQRAIASAVGSAPTAGRELCSLDQSRRKNREPTTATDVLLFAERLVEMHDLVVWKAVHQNQVVPRTTPPYREAGELAGRNESG